MNDIIKQKLDDYLLEMKAVDESRIPQVREKFFEWYNSISFEEKNKWNRFGKMLKKRHGKISRK